MNVDLEDYSILGAYLQIVLPWIFIMQNSRRFVFQQTIPLIVLQFIVRSDICIFYIIFKELWNMKQYNKQHKYADNDLNPLLISLSVS